MGKELPWHFHPLARCFSRAINIYVHEEFGSIPNYLFEFFFFHELEFQRSHIKIRKLPSSENIGCGATYHSHKE